MYLETIAVYVPLYPCVACLLAMRYCIRVYTQWEVLNVAWKLGAHDSRDPGYVRVRVLEHVPGKRVQRSVLNE